MKHDASCMPGKGHTLPCLMGVHWFHNMGEKPCLFFVNEIAYSVHMAGWLAVASLVPASLGWCSIPGFSDA